MKYGRYDSVLLIRIDTKLKEQVRTLAYASNQSLASFTRSMLKALVSGQFKALVYDQRRFKGSRKVNKGDL